MTPLKSKPSPSPIRAHWRSGLALAAIATLLCLFAVEIGLRIFRRSQAPVTLEEIEARRDSFEGQAVNAGDIIVASSDPGRVYELVPKLDVFFQGVRFQTNAAGFRDAEFSTEKPSGTIRIAALGDSTTFGWKVEREEIFTEAVERLLNAHSAGPRFEVLNFGVFGYNTAMEKDVFFDEALPRNPDVVWLQFDGNDVDLPNFIKRRENVWRLDRLYLWDFLTSRRFRWGKDASPPPPAPSALEHVPVEKDENGGNRFRLDPDRIPPELRDTVGTTNTARLIREIGRACRERNLPAVFVLNPNLFDSYTAGYTATDDPFFAPFLEAARESGFAIADPTIPIVEFLDARDLTSEDLMVDPSRSEQDAHPSPPRHTLIGLAIVRTMLENDMLPGGAFDASRRESLLADFHDRAARQWNRMGRSAFVDTLGSNTLVLMPAAPRIENAAIGDGWYLREATPDNVPFRWCRPRATLNLPAGARRLLLEVGSAWPKKIGPPDQVFRAGGRALDYSVIPRGARNWVDIYLPASLADAGSSITISLECRPLDIPGIPEGERRPWGLLVYRILVGFE